MYVHILQLCAVPACGLVLFVSVWIDNEPQFLAAQPPLRQPVQLGDVLRLPSALPLSWFSHSPSLSWQSSSPAVSPALIWLSYVPLFADGAEQPETVLMS